MENLQIDNAEARTGMLIRRPVPEVFQAFINPEITTKFWFTKSTGLLEVGKQVEWIWEMYNFRVPVIVKKIEPNTSIVIEWGNYHDMSTVEWTFQRIGKDGTYVSIVNSGFRGDPTEVIAKVSDSTKGFTFALAGLKALLEHDIQLNLVMDAFPEGKSSRQ